MPYQATCTFDLKNGSPQDYQNAYADLKALELNKVVVGTSAEVVIPTTMTLGTFNGASAEAVRDHLREQVRQAFTRRRLRSEIFITVGLDGTWGSTTT